MNHRALPWMKGKEPAKYLVQIAGTTRGMEPDNGGTQKAPKGWFQNLKRSLVDLIQKHVHVDEQKRSLISEIESSIHSGKLLARSVFSVLASIADRTATRIMKQCVRYNEQFANRKAERKTFASA